MEREEVQGAALRETGGAHVGGLRATWPFARLEVRSERLAVHLLLVETYGFSPEDVVALEPGGGLPILGRGVRIVHTVRDYPEHVEFWCLGSARRLIERIEQRGFRPCAPADARVHRRGMAIRPVGLAALAIAWIALVLLEGSLRDRGGSDMAPIAVVLLGSLALERSRRVQAWALKPGRSIGELRPVLRLLVVVCAIVLAVGLAARGGAG